MTDRRQPKEQSVILDSIGEGVFTVGLDWRITSFNRAAAGKLLTEHLEDFKQSLLAKGNTTEHVEIVMAGLRRIVHGYKFKNWSDISASRVQRYLAE